MKRFNTIQRVKVQGCCGGVRKAIDTARKVRSENPDGKVTVLGELVHNRYVIEDLKRERIQTIEGKGITRLELLEKVTDGIIIFTAHGVSDEVRDKANRLGLKTVDASCPFVLSTQDVIRKKLNKGYTVFYIGKPGHPEAEAACGTCQDIYLIDRESSIPDNVRKPVFVTNQTTMSILDIRDLFESIRQKYPEAEFHDEICNATRLRQEAVLDLKNTDVLVVVGDPLSNNTRQLEAVGHKAGIPLVFRVESARDLDPATIPADSRIAVTSGASTPGYLVDEVIQKLETA